MSPACWRASVCLTLSVAMLSMSAVGPAARAEELSGDQLALAVADAQKANLKELAGYLWHSTTTLAKADETVATSVVQMRFDEDGKLDPTFLEGQSNVPQKRGVRGRAQKQKMSEAADYLQRVVTQSFSYMFMTKGMMVDFFDGAEITDADGSLTASKKDVFVKGDQVTLVADAGSKLVTHLTFKTLLDADEIQGDVTYALLSDGPSRPTQTVLTIPSKEFRITTETSEFAKLVE